VGGTDNMSSMKLDRHIKVVEGYLGLHMYDEALSEFKQIKAEFGIENSEVSKIEMKIWFFLERWNDAIQAGEKARMTCPQDSEVFILSAHALHEVKRTEEARHVLLHGPSGMDQLGIYHYSLSCYEAQMGMLKSARNHLRTALKIEPSFEQLALQDTNLAPLFHQLNKAV
jgi:tetratricopeptide (TPR) repeat protein